MNMLTVVRMCYNSLIPLQIVAAIFIDKFIEPYLIMWGINYGWAALFILVSCVVLESIGIKYWILEQSRDLKELLKQMKHEGL
jgi:hypothetical protein